MFNLIQLQDRLRGFSEDQLKQFLRTPDPNIPDFMVMAALDEKNDAKAQEAQMKAQNQPSVREEMLAVAGLPAMEAGQMASSMAPKSDVRANTGGDDMMTMARLAEDMPMEDDMEEDEELDIVETPIRRANVGGVMQMEDEEPMGMSYGGLVNSRAMVMGQPLMSSMRPMAETFPPRMQQQRDNLGFKNLGNNIVNRIGEKSQGEVNEFIGEVRDMADDRFDLDLNQQPQFDTGGKGFPPALRPMISQKPNIPQGLLARITTAQPMYRREGGIVSMQGGGRGMFTDPNFNPSMNLFPTRVRPRPAEAQGQGLLGSMGFDPNKFQRTDWDAQFGKYYNPDGTLKDEFKQNVASTAMNTDDQPDSVRDAQRMMDINKIPEPPKKDDDEKPPPDTDDPAPRGFLSDLTRSLDEMRKEQREQIEKNKGLALMMEGINLYKERGVPGEGAGKGIQFAQTQTSKIQDRLAQLQGLEAKIGIAGATLAQKDRATEAALKKALEKGSKMTTAQLASEIKGYSSEIGKLRKQLGEETIAFDDAKIAETEDEIKRLAELRSLYVADLKGRYGGDILDNDFLKTLLDETQEDK
jgi:hypothetical protein